METEGIMEVPELAMLAGLDDTALLDWREEARAELDRNPSAALRARYDQTTDVVTQRAARAWRNG